MPKKPTQPPKPRKPRKATSSLGTNVVDFLAYRAKKGLPKATPKKGHKETVKQEIVFVSADENFPKNPLVFYLHKDYSLGKDQQVQVTMLPYGYSIIDYANRDA